MSLNLAGIGQAILGLGLVALAAATGGPGGIGATVLFGTTTIGGVAGSLGLALTLGGISQTLMGAKEAEIAAENARRTRQEDVVSDRIVYGEAAVGGAVKEFDGHNEDNKILSTMFTLAAHPCEALVAVIINGKRIEIEPNAGQVARFDAADMIPAKGQKYREAADKALFGVRFYDGTQTVADAYMVAKTGGRWTATDVGHGYTMVRFSVRYAEPQFRNGIPDVKFIIKGHKGIFDPRTNQTGYSNNPVLCGLHWMRSEYAASTPIEGFDLPSFSTAASDCDALIARKDGSQSKRYELSAVIDSGVAWRQSLVDIENAMAGRFVDTGTVIKAYAGKTRTSVATLGLEDLVGDVTFDISLPEGENVNAVKATFLDKSKLWSNAETPLLTSQTYVDEDRGRPYVKPISLPDVDRADQAQRIAKYQLLRRRRQLRLEAAWTYAKAFELEPFDVVTVTIPALGINAQLMMVESTTFNFIGQSDSSPIRLALVEYGDDFVWSASEEGQSVSVVYGDPIDPTWDDEALLNLTAVHELKQQATDLVTGVIRVGWDIPDGATSNQVRIDWRSVERSLVDGNTSPRLLVDGDRTSGLELIGPWRSLAADISGKSAILADIEPFTRYEIVAWMVRGAQLGPPATVYCWTNDSYPEIEPVYNVRLRQVGVDDVEIKWDIPRSRDVAGVEISYGLSSQAEDATIVKIDTSGRTATVHKIAPGPAYFWLRAMQANGRRGPAQANAPHMIQVTKTFGKLANRDQVTLDVLAPVVSKLQSLQLVDTKESVGNAYERSVFVIYDVPDRAGVAVPCILHWSFWLGSAQPATKVFAQVRLDGVTSRTWEISLPSKPAYPAGNHMLLLSQGQRRIELWLKTEGGTSVLKDISMISDVSL